MSRRSIATRVALAGGLALSIAIAVPHHGATAADSKIAPSGQRCFELDGDTGGAAIVNLTPVEATTSGNGQLISSDAKSDPPTAANVNFGLGSIDPNVAVAQIGADGEVCFQNSIHGPVHLIADHLGTIDGNVYTPATSSGAPERKVDTRIGGLGDYPDDQTYECAENESADDIVFVVEIIGGVPMTRVDEICWGSSAFPASRCSSGETADFFVADTDGVNRDACYDDAHPTIAPAIAPSSSECFDVTGDPGDAAIVNLTPLGASTPGNGLLVSSDVKNNPPTAANVNFRPGLIDPNVAVAQIGADGQVCLANSVHGAIHLVADHLGTIDADVYEPALASGAPDRKLDTRQTAIVGPSGQVCFDVAGGPGNAAIINLTPVQADGFGNGILISSDVKDDPPDAANVNYRPGSIDPNVAVAPIGDDGQVCFQNSVHASVHLIADHLGTISETVYFPAAADGAPSRVLDTRG